LVIALVFRVKYCTSTNVDSFNENDEQYFVNCEFCSSLCVFHECALMCDMANVDCMVNVVMIWH